MILDNPDFELAEFIDKTTDCIFHLYIKNLLSIINKNFSKEDFNEIIDKTFYMLQDMDIINNKIDNRIIYIKHIIKEHISNEEEDTTITKRKLIKLKNTTTTSIHPLIVRKRKMFYT